MTVIAQSIMKKVPKYIELPSELSREWLIITLDFGIPYSISITLL